MIRYLRRGAVHIILACLLFLTAQAQAAYTFESFGNTLSGTFSPGINYPFSVVVWVKRSAAQWDETVDDYIVDFGDDTSDQDNTASLICCNSAADRVAARVQDGSSGISVANNDFTAGAYDDEWVMVAGVFTSATDRKTYIFDSSTPGTSSTSRTLSNDLTAIVVGAVVTGANRWPGLVSHLAVFDIALTEGNIDALQTGSETGIPPCSVAPGDCIAYWPLTVNQGSHADESGNSGPTLTVNSATYSSDGPTITVPSESTAVQRRRRMMQ